MLRSILADSSAFREHGKFWTAAWSLVEGCTPVSPGCAHCWLSALEGRVGAKAVPGTASVPSPLAPNGVFNGKIVCREDRLFLPLRARKPRVYSIWSDLGHEDVPFGFHALAHDVMKRSTQHHFLVITKRPESFLYNPGLFDPLPNVTLLVTMEDQLRADQRAPFAADLAMRGWRVGVLCEPLLGPISFRWIAGDSLSVRGRSSEHDFLRLMSWVITGGESGPKARPAHPDWFRKLRDQAAAAGVPFMFKQWGEYRPARSLVEAGSRPVIVGCDESRRPASGCYHVSHQVESMLDGTGKYAPLDCAVVRLGKAKAGRTLDGREWLEVP